MEFDSANIASILFAISGLLFTLSSIKKREKNKQE